MSVFSFSNSILRRSINKTFDEGCHFEAEMTEIVLIDILRHHHFSNFEHKQEIECEFQHKRHKSGKITPNSFSLNITKLFTNNHQQK